MLWTHWQSEGSFPRTSGAALSFDVETDKGERLAVDTRETALCIAVRLRATRNGAPTAPRPVFLEVGWVSPGDEVTVEGEVVDGDRTICAYRISFGHAQPVVPAPHRVPRGNVQVGRAVPDPEPHPAVAASAQEAAGPDRRAAAPPDEASPLGRRGRSRKKPDAIP